MTHPGDSYIETLTFKDDKGELYDPMSVTVSFISPSKTVEGALSILDLTRTGEGVYELVWSLPVDAASGTWVRRVVATTDDDKTLTFEEPFNVSTQPYGTLSVVKRLCNLSDTTAKDVDLSGYLDDATDFINTALRRAGESRLPLDPVPPEIARIASFYAAGMFLQRDTADARHPYVSDAKAELEAYIQAAYHTASRAPKIFVTSEVLGEDD
jgi:hypothetical protein